MKLRSLTSAGLLFVVTGSLFGMACGSEVQTSGGTSSSSSSSSSTSGSGNPAQDCADACHKLDILNCTQSNDCNTDCAMQIADYPTECATSVAAYFACLVQNTNSCEFPAACKNAETALKNCKATYGCTGDGICSAGQDMMGNAMCGCEDTCKGIKYSTNCTTMSGATMTSCDCLISDKSVGTCTQTNANACGPDDSCCNAMYFKF